MKYTGDIGSVLPACVLPIVGAEWQFLLESYYIVITVVRRIVGQRNGHQRCTFGVSDDEM